MHCEVTYKGCNENSDEMKIFLFLLEELLFKGNKLTVLKVDLFKKQNKSISRGGCKV